MSADRWSNCPRCRHSLASLEARLVEAYGKVPLAEYETFLAAMLEEKDKVAEETLREDWVIGIYEKEFIVDYGASCERCGFKYAFKHRVPLNIDKDA